MRGRRTPHSTPPGSACRSARRRCAPPATPGRSPAALTNRGCSGKVDRADCATLIAYTHSRSQPAVSLQPEPYAKNGRLRPCADPARLACGAVGRLCGAADRAPAAPDVVAVNAMRRDGFGREALPPGALAVDHGFPASVAATPVLAVAGGSAVRGREARRHIWLFTTHTNGPQLGHICRASAFRRRKREPVPMARTPIESRANDVGTGAEATRAVRSRPVMPMRFAGVPADAPHPASPTSTSTSTCARGLSAQFVPR